MRLTPRNRCASHSFSGKPSPETPNMKSNPLPRSRPARRGAALCFALLCLTVVSPLSATIFNVSTAAQFTSALSAVQPGDTIELSGTITSSAKFSTTRHGTSSAPITITGTGTAIIDSSANYGVEILHDYYRLSNFQIKNPGKGIVIDNAEHGVVDSVHCMDIGQEAFKVRNQSRYWLFTFCSARRTGQSGNYGEGFYVGQASSNWIGGVPDQSSYVTFFNCYTIDTRNDGWDIKEGAHHVKMVNCTADFSGPIEPAHNASVGSAGFYLRADNIQVIKSLTHELNNTDWAYRISNQTVNGIDYGSTGNEIKQSSVTGGNVALIFAESGTNARVYTDCVAGPGGLIHSGSSAVTQPAPSTFSELTWSGEGGGIYGTLASGIGADGDPLQTPPPSQVAAPVFNPAGGTYTTAQSITITSATSGAAIRYTTNGTTPTSTTGTLYSSPVAIATTTTLRAIAYKSGMSDSSVTVATYTISTGGGGSGSQNISITAGSDDAKQRASGTVVHNSWRHPLGYDGSEQLEIGLRFPGVNIPPGAIVTTAWIQFEADKSNSGTSTLTLRGEKSANAATFTTAANSITNRPVTTASASWSPPSWTQGDRGAAQKTTELKTIVQEIVNQGGWSAGNAMVFIIDGTGTRTAEAAESGAAKSPQLHLEWQ